jgi:predicted transcriptional regulator
MRDIEFIIVTPENVEQVFEDIESDDIVIFGVTDKGYEDIALNLADLRAYIQQQKKVIGIYESQYDE